jgi:hypothetical protein
MRMLKGRSTSGRRSVTRCALDALESRRMLTVPVITVVNSGDYTFVGGVLQMQSGQSLHTETTATFAANQPDSINHKITWNFGDTTGGSKYNVLPGFNAGHIYYTPGDYQVRLGVSGYSDEATLSVHVTANPRGDAANTVYVAAGGTGNGSSAATPANWATAVSRLTALGSDTTVRFRQGDTIYMTTDGTSSGTHVPFEVGGLSNVEFSDYADATSGPGQPTLRFSTAATSSSVPVNFNAVGAEQILVRNLKIEGYSGGDIGRLARYHGHNAAFDNLQVKHLGTVLDESASDIRGMLVQDCTTGTESDGSLATTYAGFLYCSPGISDVVLLGNQVGDQLNQHDVRTYADRVLLYQNQFTNFVQQGGTQTMRANSGQWLWWAQNTTHSGSMETEQGVNQTPVKYVVIEGNRFLSDGDGSFSDQRVRVRGSGVDYVMFRNNYVEPVSGMNAIDFQAAHGGIINNTGRTTTSTESFLSLYGNATRGVYLQNNLWDAPANAVAVSVNVNNLDMCASVADNAWNTGAVFRFVGIANNLNAWNSASMSDFEDDVALGEHVSPSSQYRPSAAAVFATPRSNVFDDLWQRPRPTGANATWTAGAVERAGATLTIGPSADTFAKGDDTASTTHGGESTINVKSQVSTPAFNREAFVGFDLTKIGGTIGSAKVRLWGMLNVADSVPVAIYESGSFSESTTN